MFSDLTTKELYEILKARARVFFLEQKIKCLDMDGVDYDAYHCFLEADGGEVVAYLRAYESDGEAKIGRVLSIRHGIGLGSELMRLSLPQIFSIYKKSKICADVQTHAAPFYEKLGFSACGYEFLEEGIPHIKMILNYK